MYGREIDGKTHTFGVSGMLLRNALVMYDRETESFWSHYTGEGLAGPLKGKTLKMIASSPRVKFGAWRKAHPKTLVLQVDGRSHSPKSSYESYFKDPAKTGVIPVQNVDSRLPPKSLVLGFLVDDQAVAVPIRDDASRVVMTTVGKVRVAVFYGVELGLFGAAVLPEGVSITSVEGRELVTDDGTRYDAVEGAGAEGRKLTLLPTIRSFWFAWAEHHPETKIAGNE